MAVPKDIVIDTNVVRLYNAPGDPNYRELFSWLAEYGTLAVSKKLLKEYFGTGNVLLAGLIERLIREGRLLHIENGAIKAFNRDKHFEYTCNMADWWHAKLVFVSPRKLLISLDVKLVSDVNRFPRIGRTKPWADKYPSSAMLIREESKRY